MKENLILATQNPGKIAEMSTLLEEHFEVLGLPADMNKSELPETGDTLEHNALQKARFVYEHTGQLCLADDTGLEVDALSGRPGVYSARYAGPQKSADDNMALLLKELQGIADRKARFRTVMALVGNEVEETFDGIVNGTIDAAPRGEGGFGYDPIFIPEGEHRTFAQMSKEEKGLISHRGRAIRAFLEYVRKP